MVICSADCDDRFELSSKTGKVAPAESENHSYVEHLVRV
jgi:hypothetical protein